MNTIINDFIIGLTDNASSKTARYFIGPKDSSFIQDTVDVIFTLLSIRAKAKAGNIVVNGDQRAVTDYVAPVNIIKLIQAGRVWATTDAIETENVYHKSTDPVTEVKVNNVEYVGKLVSPEKVAAYFIKYNANQSDETKVETAQINFEEVAVLMNFKSLVSQSNPEMLVPMGAAGVEDLVAFYNGIKCPISDAYVTKYPVVSEEARGRWLISIKSSQ